MKKSYIKPKIQVVQIELSQVLCLSSDNNGDVHIGGPGSGDGRAARHRDWQDWEES